MEKHIITYKGKEYLCAIVSGEVINLASGAEAYPNDYNFVIADDELWEDIEDDYYNGDKDAVDIDNEIFFYCSKGFLSSNPSDKEIEDFLKKYL